MLIHYWNQLNQYVKNKNKYIYENVSKNNNLNNLQKRTLRTSVLSTYSESNNKVNVLQADTPVCLNIY